MSVGNAPVFSAFPTSMFYFPVFRSFRLFQNDTTRIRHNTLAAMKPNNPADVPIKKQPIINGRQRSRNSVNNQLKLNSKSKGPK